MSVSLIVSNKGETAKLILSNLHIFQKFFYKILFIVTGKNSLNFDFYNYEEINGRLEAKIKIIKHHLYFF